VNPQARDGSSRLGAAVGGVGTSGHSIATGESLVGVRATCAFPCPERTKTFALLSQQARVGGVAAGD